MAIITLDFETFYRSAKDRKTGEQAYSLKSLTYEEYMRHPEFHVHGVGVKINDGKTEYIYENIKEYLTNLFYIGNDHIFIGHNTIFDAAILSWYYGLRAKSYYCTQSMSQALWAQSSASLENLAKRLFPDDKKKRKGKELASFDGIKRLTHEQQKIMGGYCINDVDLTYECFKSMYPYFPNEEFDLIDLTIKMFAHPKIQLERSIVIEYQKALVKKRAELIRDSGVPEAILKSSDKFAKYLKEKHNIDVPIVVKPTPKNPNNETWALAKGDVEFIKLQADNPHLKHIWDARLASTSSGELARCQRFLDHAQVSNTNPLGLLAVPLKYCGAHTKRYSGTNSVNMQNLKRKSPLRLALFAQKGFKVLVRDLSNIEGRVNAWFNGQEDKLRAFASGADIYDMVASDIYKKPIKRKLKATDAAGNYIDKNGNICNYDDAHEPFELEGRVGKVAELGLGYNMGVDKFRLQLYLAGLPADHAFAEMVVKTWRAKNHMIVRGWKKADQIIFDMARKDLVPYQWGCLTIEHERIRLPGGLYLTYPNLTKNESEDRKGFEYWNGKFMKSIYGGLLIENIIQALARIIMTTMMLAIQKRVEPLGGDVVLTVHDELVVIAPDEHAEECMQIMDEEMKICPWWCNDGRLVLASAGGMANNYSK